MGFTGTNWVFLGLIGFGRFGQVLPGLSGFHRGVGRVFTGFYWVLPGWIVFGRVLPGPTGFSRVC